MTSMRLPDWQKEGLDHLWMPYTQMQTAPTPLAVERTAGCEIVLHDGRRLLDAISSWWTVAHGYNHPHIVEAIQSQLALMPHVMMGGIQHPQAARLAKRLAALLPGSLNRVFFCDSGSVSVEVALKISVQYWLNQGRSGKNRFVSFRDAYHGDTVGAMSVCDPLDSMHAHFKGFLLQQYPRAIPQTEHDWSEFESFVDRQIDSLAGVIIEPLLQAAGGMRFHAPHQLKRLAETCRDRELLLITDEVATGFGRTGAMFAIDQAGVTPDIVCLGKGMTGGAIGMAAAVTTEDVFGAFQHEDASFALMHGPTFMGNALACAAANASLDLFESEPRLEQAAELEKIARLELGPLCELDHVKDTRFLGAVAVVQMEREPHKYQVMQQAIDRGVWLRPLGDAIYTMPPLVMELEPFQRVCQVIREIVVELGIE